VPDALAAEIGKGEVDELLCDAASAMLWVNDEVIDAPAIMRATVGINRDHAEKHIVFLGDVNGRTDMQATGNPVLPERHTRAEYAIFLAKTFVRHRLILVPK